MTTVGVLGGGQLGRMLALAGVPLGLRFRFLDPSSHAPAGAVGWHVRGGYEDPVALARFAEGLDVATYEFENVSPAAADWLAERVPVRPSPHALRVTRDRFAEKRLVRDVGGRVPACAEVTDAASLRAALAAVGTPALLKSRFGGYDGRGQARVDAPEDAERAWDALGRREALFERRIPFRRELAILAVRGLDGATRTWPLVETHQPHGILARAIAPAPGVPAALAAEAEALATRLLDALGHVGVLTVECFEHEGALLVNELAPRVHNSGHWTIEGAETSQFANHLRAILGLPLGETGMRGHAGLVNLLGRVPERAAVLALPDTHLHLYDKHPQPGRKLGHVTVLAPSAEALAERMQRLERLLA